MIFKLARFACLILGVWTMVAGVAAVQPDAGGTFVTLDGVKVHPEQILARLRDPAMVDDVTRRMAAKGFNVKRKYHLVPGLLLVDVRPGPLVNMGQAEAARFLKRRIGELKSSGWFIYVEPDRAATLYVEPNDAAYHDGRLWGLLNYGQFGGVEDADIDAAEAWNVTTGNKEIIAAIIDTGVRYTHVDLKNQMWVNEGEIPGNGVDDDGDGWVDNVHGIDASDGDGDPDDPMGHGTHCAGTVGAEANNGEPHVGVAWKVRLMACKMFGSGGFTSAAITSVEFSVDEGATVSNCSWGGTGTNPPLYDAFKAGGEAGMVFSCASGNSAMDNDQIPDWPSGFDLECVIAVAASDNRDDPAYFTNYGLETVDLAAPGVDIFSSVSTSDTSYEFYDGTSMAGPHVAGVIALMQGLAPNWSVLQIREKLLESVDVLPSFDGLIATSGRVNAYSAVEGMAAGVGVPDGMMQVAISPPSGSMLMAGSSTNIFVTVIDGVPVKDAVVVGLVQQEDQVSDFYFNNTGDAPDVTGDDNIYSNVFDLPEKGGKLKMTLIITAPNKQEYIRVIRYDVVPIPDNDHFSNAAKITGFGGTVEGFNTFATVEADEPVHAESPDQAGSLWWNWSPPVDGRMYADIAGCDIDATIAVYVGTGLLSAVKLTDNSPVFGRRPDYVTWDGKSGRTYRICVAGLTQDELGYVRLRVEVNGEPDFTLPVVRVTSPPNGIAVTTNRVEVTGIALDPQPNSSGIREVLIGRESEPGFGVIGREKWRMPVVLKNGLNKFRIMALDFSGNISKPQKLYIDYHAPEVPNDHFVNATPANQDHFVANGNQTQFRVSQAIIDLDKVSITIDGLKVRGGAVSISEINNRFLVFNEPPDEGAKIEVFHPIWLSNSQDTSKATRENGEPFHTGNEGAGSIWYSFTAPADGLFSVSTINATFDTVMGMYMGSRVDNLNLVAFNDEDPALKEVEDNPGLSRIDQALRKGMVVYIAVDGFGGTRGVVGLLSEFQSGIVHRVAVSVDSGGKIVSPLSQPFKDENGHHTLFAHDMVARLEVNPDGGNFFEGWQGAIHSGDNPLDLVITEDIEVVANFGSVSLTENFETGDLGHLQWKTSGNADWFVQSEYTSGSKFAAQSGAISDGQTSSLILEADFTAGQGGFEVQVFTERTWDKLVFLIDDRKIEEWSGIQGWGNYTFNVSQGSHVLEWRYQKDFANSFGEDTVWLDNIDLPLKTGASLALEKSGDSLLLRLWGRPGHRYDIEVSTDFLSWEKWDSVFIDSEGVKLLVKEIELNASTTRFFRAVAP